LEKNLIMGYSYLVLNLSPTVYQGFAEKSAGWKEKTPKINMNLPVKIIFQAGRESKHTDIRRPDLSEERLALDSLDVFTVG
jgi:hypothetical protein